MGSDTLGFGLHNMRIVLCKAREAKSSVAGECIKQLLNPVTVCVMCPKSRMHSKTIFHTESQQRLATRPCRRHFCI